MKRPGFINASMSIAGKDLTLEWRTLETIASSTVFSLIVLVIFNFSFGPTAAAEFGVERMVPGVIWLVLAFAAVVGMARSMQLERQRETMTAIFLAPIDRGAIFCGKFMANLVRITVLQWIVLPLSAVFFNFDLFSIALPLVLILFVHAVGLTELGTLFAAVATRVGRGEALLATLLFPAASPILISATKTTSAVLAGEGLESVSRWILITVGFDVLYFFVALSTFEFVLEE